jgi:hypothetical protein
MAPKKKQVVSRAEKKRKYLTFCVYFAAKDSGASKKALRAVCGRAKNPVRFDAVTSTRVELTWPQPVTHDSPRVLLRQALEKLPTFTHLGEPTPVGQSAAPQSPPRAAAAAGTPTASVNQAASGSETDAPPRKRVRHKRAPTRRDWKPVSGGQAAATVSEETPTAAALPSEDAPQPLHLLPLKMQECWEYLAQPNRFVERHSAFTVDWDAFLGSGSYGDVYRGTRRGLEEGSSLVQDVAVKTAPSNDHPNSDQISQLRNELLRYAALPSHPGILRVLDVAAVSNFQLGVAFDLYTIDLRDLLDQFRGEDGATSADGFQPAGRRHVMRSVVTGLEHLHLHGLVHGDLSPKNVLLRGDAQHRACWLHQLLEPPIEEFEFEDPGHICPWRHQLPCASEVGNRVGYLQI